LVGVTFEKNPGGERKGEDLKEKGGDICYAMALEGKLLWGGGVGGVVRYGFHTLNTNTERFADVFGRTVYFHVFM
jgi:hypothetical protein